MKNFNDFSNFGFYFLVWRFLQPFLEVWRSWKSRPMLELPLYLNRELFFYFWYLLISRCPFRNEACFFFSFFTIFYNLKSAFFFVAIHCCCLFAFGCVYIDWNFAQQSMLTMNCQLSNFCWNQNEERNEERRAKEWEKKYMCRPRKLKYAYEKKNSMSILYICFGVSSFWPLLSYLPND